MDLQTPIVGPFRLTRGYSIKKVGQAFLWFLLFAGLGVGGIGFCVYISQKILETNRIWARGVYAQSSRMSGKVETTNLVFKEYKLTLRYTTKKGEYYTKRVEFYRWFTGPDSSTSFRIKYLPENPKKANISWAYDARWHGWSFAVLIALLGVLFLLGLALPYGMLKDLQSVRRLRHSGELIWVDIHSFHVEHVEQAEHFVYGFLLEKGVQQEFEYKATTPGEVPFLDQDAERMLVLCSRSSNEHSIILRDGAPLRFRNGEPERA